MLDWLKKLFGLVKKAAPTTPSPQPSGKEVQAPPPAPTPPPQKPKQKYKKLITVGVDFGTSSTKVILGDVSTGKHHLLDLTTPTPGYPNSVLPSAIRISEGQIFFGANAERGGRAGIVFRSFKVCLACEIGIAGCRKCDHRLHDTGRGQFAVSADNPEVVISAHQLCTWYLAYVFNIARREATLRWGESFELGYIFNVGAPIDQHNLDKGKEAFNKVAYWAEMISPHVEDGARIQTLLTAYEKVGATNSTVPGPENRSTFIQPETAAGLMPFVMAPTAPTGLYGIVDVGAGTTDVSFFRLADVVREERVMAFYDAGTLVVGSDDIDRQAAHHVLSCIAGSPGHLQLPTGNVITACRRAKERLGEQESVRIRIGEKELALSRKDLEDASASTIKAMVTHYVEVNRRAYKKDKRVNNWCTYTLFLLGGGTRMKAVADALRRARPSEYNRNILFNQMTAPKEFEAPSEAKANFDLFAVAYGLSYPPVDFPKIFDPSEVEPLQITLPLRRKLSHEELYQDR